HNIKGTPTQKDVKNVRNDAGLNAVPQLILYIIDKESEPTQKMSKNRSKLSFEEDVVGMNLYIPGNTNNKNLASYLSVAPKLDDEVDNYDEYVDIEEE